MAKTAPKRKAANGYKLADPLPKGEILQDLSEKQWKLGPSIGQGGFGEIYSAQEVGAGGSKYPYVVKIEPHANGPLFVEMHFYLKNARYEDVEEFKKEKGLKTFGMPLYLGSGSHEYMEKKYRFIVMNKFGTDLWKLFLDNNRIFPATTVFKVAIQILDVLEYIHKRGYVHADIKGANILMGTTKDTQNKQVYLVDFGLASKYNCESVFKPNPKKAHDGTIEYLSRDAHQGVQSRRGDLEILAYNIIQWLGCNLPWEKHLKDPKVVQQSKEEYMANVPKFMKACFEKKSPPGPVVDFLNYHSTLKHDSVPDYKNVRKIFLSGLEKGDALGKPLHFSPSKKTPVKRKIEENLSSPKLKKGRKKLVEPSDEECADDDQNQTTPQKRKRGTKQASPNVKRGKKKLEDNLSEDEKENMVDEVPAQENSVEIQLSENEEIVDSPPKRGRGRKLEKETTSKRKTVKKNVQEPLDNGHEDSEDNDHGAEMDTEESTRPARRVRARRNYREDSDDEEESKKKPSMKAASTKKVHVTGDNTDGYNDAMKEVLRKKMQNGKSNGKKKETQVEDEDMVGYTDSMKEIVMKNKKKAGSRRGRDANPIPAASTSSRKGLGRARKGITEPVSRHDVIGQTESDSE